MENTDLSLPTLEEHPQNPPEEPRPWRWKCHECNCQHRLSCTRRCFNCGHTLCFAYEGFSKKSKTQSCVVLFDYSRWIGQTRWRRRIQLQRASNTEDQANPPAERAENAEQAENAEADEPQNTVKQLSLKAMLRNGTYSCFDHCIFPGYCIRKLRGMEQPQASSVPRPPMRPARINLKVPNLGKKRKLSRTMPRKHRPRGRHGFQKKPSPLSQVWQLESDSSVDAEMTGIQGAQCEGQHRNGK